MKSKTIIFSFLFILCVPIASFSQSMGMKSWRQEGRCWRASELNLSSEQEKTLNLLQKTLLREIQLLRAQLLTKRIELRELLTNPAIKTEIIRIKYLELVETQSKMEEKAIEYLMKVRSLLTQEQLKSWCPELEIPFFQRMIPGHGPMGPRPPRKPLPPEE